MRLAVHFAALAALAATLPACSGLGYRRPVTVEHPRVQHPSGLEYEDVLPGLGAEARLGDSVTVDYTAWLASEAEGGHEFDSSHHRGNPVTFELGAAPLPAWDAGIPGMREGGHRKLFAPPELAYGAQGVPDLVPPDAPLVFLIELVAVAPPDASEPPVEPAPTEPAQEGAVAPDDDATKPEGDAPAPEPEAES